MLKDYLDSKNLSFIEKLIDVNEAAREEIEKESGGFLGVPFVVVNFADGRRETVIGFDKGRLEQILQNP